MNIVIDIGNTTAKVAVFDSERLIEVLHQSNQSLEGLQGIIRKYPVEYGLLSSVIDLSWMVKSQLKHFPVHIKRLNMITRLPLANLYKSPETLGDDRLAAAVGAYNELPERNILVIDAGTCITYDIVTAKGEYLGGNISPGKSARFKSMHRLTAHLPLIDENGDIPELGYDTQTGMRTGVINGIKYEMKGYINEFSKIYPDLHVILTGGDGIHFEGELPEIIKYDQFLVLKGLNKILNYSNE